MADIQALTVALSSSTALTTFIVIALVGAADFAVSELIAKGRYQADHKAQRVVPEQRWASDAYPVLIIKLDSP